MYTKADIVIQAYEELRISGLTVDASREDIVFGVKRLDNLVNSWKKYNICLGYNDSADPIYVDPQQDSGVDSNDVYALTLNLAKSLAPAFGKPVSMETLSQAKIAYEGLFSRTPVKREGTPYQPMGAGSRSRYWYGSADNCQPEYQDYIKNTPSGCDSIKMKVGETRNISIDYSSLIPDDVTLSSYESSSEGGVSIDSISEDEAVFSLELTASRAVYSSIKITLTLSNGDVNPITTFVDISSS